MGYVNEKSGVTKGPIRIQHEGPWLLHQLDSYSYKTRLVEGVDQNQKPNEFSDIQEHKVVQQNTLSVFVNLSSEFKELKTSESLFDDTNASKNEKISDVVLKIPHMDTGWHLLLDEDGELIEDANGDVIFEPNAGWHAVPNIWWIKTYLDQYKDKVGNIINVANLIDRNELISALEEWKSQITKEYMHQINIDRTEIDNLQEVCDNINIGMDTEWILDGGDPTYNLRHTVEWSTVEVKEADRNAKLPS
jgi:hypothetical protein